jgi:hypothetical protein
LFGPEAAERATEDFIAASRFVPGSEWRGLVAMFGVLASSDSPGYIDRQTLAQVLEGVRAWRGSSFEGWETSVDGLAAVVADEFDVDEETDRSVREVISAVPGDERRDVLEKLGAVLVALGNYIYKLVEDEPPSAAVMPFIALLYAVWLLHAATQRAVSAAEEVTQSD